MKPKKLRKMSKAELQETLEETKTELRKVKSSLASGMQPENPSKIKHLKKDIARIKTIQNERRDQNK